MPQTELSRSPLVAAILLLTLAASSALGAEPRSAADARTAEARHLAEALHRASVVPGLSVAVGIGDRVVWSEAFGLANLETLAPARTDTLFRTGSVSKVLTAALLARLEAKGVLDLDKPIQTWLPDYPEKGAPITLRLLAGHLAGTRHYVPKDSAADAKHWESLGEALTLFQGDNLVAAPGEKYNYSTFGYTLIGAVIEAATKKTFLDALHDEVLEPLGMAHTAGDQRIRLVPGRSAFYDRGADAVTRNIAADDPSYKWPGGGLLSTGEDLVRFGLAQLGDFLTPAQRQRYFASQTTMAGEATGVGIGWRIGKDWRGRTIYHHAGSQAGARAVLVVYPQERLAVAILSNLGSTPAGIEPSAQLIAEVFLSAHEPAEVMPPGGPYLYRGTFRGEAAMGSLSLVEDGAQRRGSLSVPPPMAQIFKLQGQPTGASFEVVASWAEGKRHMLAIATPFGLLPLILEQTPEGLQGKLAMGSATLDIRLQPLTNILPVEPDVKKLELKPSQGGQR